MKGLGAIILIFSIFWAGAHSGSNTECTDLTFQYTSLNEDTKNIIIDYLDENIDTLTASELAAGVQETIGDILSNIELTPSDHAILTNFYNYEISPGNPSTICIVNYELGL